MLVTLLLGNVITNETLPIVLDRSLGGGWPAVLGSTVLIGKIFYIPSGDSYPKAFFGLIDFFNPSQRVCC